MSHAPVCSFAACRLRDFALRMRIPHAGRGHASASRYQDHLGAAFHSRTEAYHTETVMTNAVIREFATRTRFRVIPTESPEADAVLHGAILNEASYAAHLQLLDAAVVQLPHHHRGFGHAERGRRQGALPEQELSCTASSTSRPPTWRRLSRRTRRPWSACRVPLPGSWLPMCWKASKFAGL